ncbi:Ca2+-binding RTX toxin-like protein [Ruminiclostridium sufflavum DSM 19573]|uniref:Ca2+-binding RTX toxin-like protein n=1 Tax=Ruminiclostridium sufflavum DSM 19573 TaxID=1121337 RepID=A0A318XLT4_9FIRM|nr:Ca2+-binding RTX toxin-like protein [Ruminiclostridium sufflavum DSM 19573]
MGYGNDTISDSDSAVGNIDTIALLDGIIPDDTELKRNGSNLEISIRNTQDKLTVSNYFYNDNYKVEQIRFADGTTWNIDFIKKAVLNINGSENDDNIQGCEDGETIAAAGGYDIINGNGGNDIIYGGAGDDTITGGNGNDAVYGNDGYDKLYGNAGSDILDGGSGNDYLEGGAGDDTYAFGRGYGQDTVYEYDSTSGNVDTVSISKGILPSEISAVRRDNNLELAINGTTDKLTIKNYFSTDNAYKVEQIKFEDGTIWDIDYVKNAARYITGTALDDTLAGFNDQDDIIDGQAGNDTITAGKGTDILMGGEGNDKLYGQDGNDILSGGSGTDYLEGGAGDDTYIFGKGFGEDTVYDSDSTGGNKDVISFSEEVAPKDVTARRNADNLELLINGTEDKLIIKNYFSVYDVSGYNRGEAVNKIEIIKFADSTVWDAEYIKNAVSNIKGTEADDILRGFNDGYSSAEETINGYGGNDTLYGGISDDLLYGGSGADSLYGEAGNDILFGGAGNDMLYGGSGNDTYIYNKGDGRDIITDEAFNWGYSASKDWNGTVWNDGGGDAFDGFGATAVTVNGETVSNIAIGAADGTERSITAGGVEFKTKAVFIEGNILELTISTGAGFENIAYSVTNSGNLGSDGNANSTEDYLCIGGNQVKYMYCTDNSRSDPNVLYMMYSPEDMSNPAVYRRTGDNVSSTLSEVTGTVKIYILPDRLDKQTSSETLESILNGSGTGKKDVLRLGEGLTPEDIEVTRAGADLLINMASGADGITIKDWYNNNSLSKLEFADGTFLDRSVIHTMGLNVSGTDGDDTLKGLNGENDVISGGLGNDTITGYSGNDTLTGGEGNDKLYGQEGNDLLDGGTGNDYLEGASGNDTYVFGANWGQDTIYDYDTASANEDVVQFGDDALKLIFAKNGKNLNVSVNGRSDLLTINSWYSGSASQIEQFKASDGSILSNSRIEQLIQAMAAFTAENGMSWNQAIEERPEEVQNILTQFWVHQ